MSTFTLFLPYIYTPSRAEIFKSLFHIHYHCPISPSVLSGPPGAPTVVSASKTCIALTWTPPVDDRGVPIIGYQVEKRKKDTHQWVALNPVNEPIEGLYWLNVLAISKSIGWQMNESSHFTFTFSWVIYCIFIFPPTIPSTLSCKLHR